MTRIAHVNLSAGFRGGERQTQILIRGLHARGWEQALVARRGELLASRMAAEPGLDVREVRNNAFSAARALRDADLIHVHEGRAGQAALVANLLRGTPYIITRRIPQLPSGRLTTRMIYRRAAHIAGVARAVVEAMQDYEPAVAKSCIYSAVAGFSSDPEIVATLRANWEGKLVAGNVAALVDKHKGQKVLIEAARGLLGSHPQLVFVLVGSGRDEAELRALAADLPNVVFEGYRTNVGDYLAAFDLFVFPSREEGIGGTVLDAMRAGLPVVASRVGGIPEAVADGETGILVPPGDSTAFSEAVARLAEDASLRERMGERGRERATRFSPESMVEAYDGLYRQVLGRGPEGR